MALVLAGCSGDSAGENPHKTEPLLNVLDSANMMLVTPVGLGDRAKGKVISGRLYENFVQLLRLAGARESLLDTFHTECATGLRVQLFHDTLSVAELRIADKIGYVGEDIGVWEPEKPVTMAKITTFLRNQGINFRPCPMGESEGSEDGGDALARLILSHDTAIGKPLYEIVKDADRATVGFTRFVTRRQDIGKQVPGKVELDSSQLQELLSLLRTPKRESFSGGCLCLSKATIAFYSDSVETFRLQIIGNDYGTLEKHNLVSGVGASGIWESANPQAFQAFFERIKASLAIGAPDTMNAPAANTQKEMRRELPAHMDGRESVTP